MTKEELIEKLDALAVGVELEEENFTEDENEEIGLAIDAVIKKVRAMIPKEWE